MQYEICYLIGESKESQLEKIKRRVEEILIQEKAEILESEVWEKRKLAYKVRQEIRGIFVARRFNFSQDNATNQNSIANIVKKFNLEQDILRFIIVKADELPELKKKEMSHIVRKENVFSKKRPLSNVISPKKPLKKKEAETKKEEIKNTREEIDQKIEEILNI